MDSLVTTFFAAADGYRAAVDRLDADRPIGEGAASAASAASIAERDAIRAVAAAPILTAQDATGAASVIAHLLTAGAWPDEARALACSLAAAVERLAEGW